MIYSEKKKQICYTKLMVATYCVVVIGELGSKTLVTTTSSINPFSQIKNILRGTCFMFATLHWFIVNCLQGIDVSLFSENKSSWSGFHVDCGASLPKVSFRIFLMQSTLVTALIDGVIGHYPRIITTFKMGFLQQQLDSRLGLHLC
ncbi:hypothetical protein ACJX0J_038808 [Zea mays]